MTNCTLSMSQIALRIIGWSRKNLTTMTSKVHLLSQLNNTKTPYTKDRLMRGENVMAMVSYSMLVLSVSMRANGQKTNVMATALRSMPMEISIMAISQWISPTGKAYTHGRMVNCTKENGNSALNMDTAFGRVSVVIHTLANGLILKLKDMACTLGRMAINTKVSG